MDEILKKLLESNVLSEDTRAQVTEEWNTAVGKYLSEERIKLEAQLTEEFVAAQNDLAEKIDAKLNELTQTQFEELKEDINSFRDLEVEAAENEVKLREELAEQLNTELEALVEKLDVFLELEVQAQFDELKEDLEEAKRNHLGQKIFEAFEETFVKHRKDNLSDVEQKLAETQDRLKDVTQRLEESEKATLAETRTSKLETVLSPLNGAIREQMKIILSNVSTERLNEAYAVYLPRLLKETVKPTTKQEVIKEDLTVPGKTVTGNESDVKTVETVDPSNSSLARMRKLAGLV